MIHGIGIGDKFTAREIDHSITILDIIEKSTDPKRPIATLKKFFVVSYYRNEFTDKSEMDVERNYAYLLDSSVYDHTPVSRQLSILS